MGFASSACSFTRFRILDPVTDELVFQIPQKLRQFAFRDIDEIPETRAFGWVCFDDMLDTAWTTAPPQKGGYVVFSLRLDTRRIPAGVIKKHVTLALREEKRRLVDANQKFISRELVKEVKEQVLLRLRQRFLPVPAEFNIVWNLADNELWFASIQDKMLDLFMEEFINSFGLHLEPLTPYAMAAGIAGDEDTTRLDALEATRFIDSRQNAGIDSGEPVDSVLGEEFLTWLWYQSDTAPHAFKDKAGEPFSVYMEQRIVVQGGQGQARETITVSGCLSPLREARFGLETGKKVTRAQIRLEKADLAWQFNLRAEDFRIASLKTPKLDNADRDDEPDAIILEKIYLLETCLALLDSLYASFLELRLSSSWENEAALMARWFGKTE